jgi:hypothetical protein
MNPDFEIVDVLHDDLLQFKERPTFLVILHQSVITVKFMHGIQVDAKLKSLKL